MVYIFDENRLKQPLRDYLSLYLQAGQQAGL